MSSDSQIHGARHGSPVGGGELPAATIRGLIIELALAEYTLRQGVTGPSTVAGDGDDLARLAEREAAIVAELRSRRMPFTLGRGALAASPNLRRSDGPDPMVNDQTDRSQDLTQEPTPPPAGRLGYNAAELHDGLQPDDGQAQVDDIVQSSVGEGADPWVLVADLKQAVEERTVIGQAQGILMSQYRLSVDGAFERLRITSQNRNRTLSDIAADLVAETASSVQSGDRVEHALPRQR